MKRLPPLHTLCLGFLSLLTGCQTLPTQPAAPRIDWQESTPQTILDTRNDRQLTAPQLLHNLLQADIIYLGEEHDNPQHHHLQLAIVEKLLQTGKRPIIGFEFFSREQTSWLLQYSVGNPSRMPTNHPTTPEERLRQQLGWEKRSDWSFYFPLVQLARQHRLMVFGADLPDGLRMRLTRDGLEALTPLERTAWIPSDFVHQDYAQLMREKFAQSHCGMVSEPFLERLYGTWLARNDAMAQAIVAMQATEQGPVILIVGAAHLTHNMGIPERVKALRPHLRQLNLGMHSGNWQELDQHRPLPPLTVGNTQFPPAHEILWLTLPSPTHSDPCAPWAKPQPAPAAPR
ncbi:MAG: ChaN family lipoprotein [Magnetococcales bacterium]|nr:ChaN family lipoprotein [Magnetococcales bacterium]